LASSNKGENVGTNGLDDSVLEVLMKVLEAIDEAIEVWCFTC